jgi:opacity protein-like surface antigen
MSSDASCLICLAAPGLVARTSKAAFRLILRGSGVDRRQTKLVYGYSLGFGVDIMLARGFFARVEYEYLRVTSNFDSNVNSVHAGIGYKF